MLSEKQIGSILDELRTDARVQGILLTGSYVYGTPTDDSDLDVRVITSDPAHKGERERIRFNTKIELFVDTVERVHFYMQQSIDEGHGACIHFWANGKIVYDPNSLLVQLQKEACVLWKKGRPDGLPWICRDEKYKRYLNPIF